MLAAGVLLGTSCGGGGGGVEVCGGDRVGT